jgi:hypothetical protein
VSAGLNLLRHIGLIEIRVQFGLGHGYGRALAHNLNGSARLETRTFAAISEKPRTLVVRQAGAQIIAATSAAAVTSLDATASRGAPLARPTYTTLSIRGRFGYRR